jgi:hypothetical protein
MVKEFGNQFEQFTLEFFKRVKKCPFIIRDYSFRKIGKTEKGYVRSNPSDIDVIGICSDKIFIITCQEYIPSGKKDSDTQIKKLIDNLKQGIDDIKNNYREWKEIVPVISCIAIKESSLSDIDNQIEKILTQKVGVIFFFDMFKGFKEEWENIKNNTKSWIPAGYFDWFFSRFFGDFKIKLSEELIEENIKEVIKRKKEYKIRSIQQFQHLNLKFLVPLNKI